MLAQMPLTLLNGSRGAIETALPHFLGGHKPVGQTQQTDAPVARVVGAPSMRLIRASGGGVKTVLRRNMTHSDLLTPSDFAALKKLLVQTEDTAQRLSRGGLSTRDLQLMGNPYGKGLRRGLGRLRGSGRGVSNMAIVNRQSGAFARSWGTQFQRDKNGVNLILENDDKKAAWLAFGTRRMKAHGPFTTAVAKHLTEIDVEWRRLAKVATARNRALAQVKAGADGV